MLWMFKSDGLALWAWSASSHKMAAVEAELSRNFELNRIHSSLQLLTVNA